MKCNHDCFNCSYKECIEDDLTPEEIAISEWLDNIAEKENEVDSNAVIRTGKRGRPKKLFPKYESETYKKEQLAKKREYYHKHKAERIAYQKAYYAKHITNPEFAQANRERALAYYHNLSVEEKAVYNLKRNEYYRRRKGEKICQNR
jgi:hypothetical protein